MVFNFCQLILVSHYRGMDLNAQETNAKKQEKSFKKINLFNALITEYKTK